MQVRRKQLSVRASLGTRSLRYRETENLFGRVFSRKPPRDVQRVARRKLEILDAAGTVEDLRIPPPNRLEKLHGKRAISADTALRLSRYFGMSDRFWINLQARYDIEMEKDLLAVRLDREVRPRAAFGGPKNGGPSLLPDRVSTKPWEVQ